MPAGDMSTAGDPGTTIVNEDGTTTIVNEDGTTTIVSEDGAMTTVASDGTVTTSADGTASSDNGAAGGTTAGGTADETGSEDTGAATAAVADGQALTMELDGSPIFARTLRLTHSQWERSVEYLLQLDGPTGHLEDLAEDAAAVKDFTNNEERLVVSGPLWSDYQAAASDLATALANDSARLSAIYSGTDAQGFIETFGRRAFRRPLTAEEVSSYQALFDLGASLSIGGSDEFARGAGTVVEAMLQSPHFLYRVELTAPGARLNGYEIAAKLSLLLRGVTPDDALLDQAASGEFDSAAGIESAATQMVEEPNMVEVMREYHSEMLRFNRFEQIIKDTQTVPEYDPELNAELEEASFMFFDRIFTENLGVRDILLSNVGYSGPLMTQLYDGAAAGGTQVGGGQFGGGFGGTAPAEEGMTERQFEADRPGFFTQLPFLILNSINQHPDSIHRGTAMNLEVLCAPVPPPTAQGVTLVEAEPDWTNRDRVEATSGDGTCGAACHGVYINPLGYAFENFDGMGRARDTDNGQPVDTTGTYPFVEGSQSFDGAPALMQIMADGEQAHACYAKHLAGYALQRDLTEADRPLVDAVTAASRASDSSIKQLILALVKDEGFAMRAVGGEQ
jgi:hypothetical protein